jgi:DNA-binding protein H-NS
MDHDLKSMSLDELKSLRGKVDRAISDFAENKKRKALAELEEKARELGYPLADLLAMSGMRKRGGAKAAGTVKYRHPENAALTWSGRGRHPRWFDEALAAGKSDADLLP